MEKIMAELTGNHGVTDDLTGSDRYRLLAADRRRTVLEVLGERTTPVDLQDLARAVAARENGGKRADQGAVQRVALALHHDHLPRMSDLGVVDYDPRTNRVESCPGLVDASTG